MRAVTIIPARFFSTRFPGKPLSKIQEKPMIQWVYERALQIRGVDRTLVATDDQRIFDVVRAFGGEAVMTSPDLKSGTERVGVVARDLNADVYINVQGDEPLLNPKGVESALQLVTSGQYPMATLMTSFKSSDELTDPNVVKILVDSNSRAKQFSRMTLGSGQRRHVGVYVYEKKTLEKLLHLPSTKSEKKEKLEQLRAMENGIPIGVAEIEGPLIGVDTPEDLDRIQKYFEDEK